MDSVSSSRGASEGQGEGATRIRPLPKGVTSENYTLCDRWPSCNYGDLCVHAHSDTELNDWLEKANLKQEQVLKLIGDRKRLLAERITLQLIKGTNRDAILKKDIDGISMYVDRRTSVILNDKSDLSKWIFTISTKHKLAVVTLLETETTANFALQSISTNSPGSADELKLPVNSGEREWRNSADTVQDNQLSDRVYRVEIQFKSQSYGSFKQTVVLAFNGLSVYLYRDLKATVRPEEIATKAADLTLTESKRWESLSDVLVVKMSGAGRDTTEESLMGRYKRPEDMETCMETVLGYQSVTPENYKHFYHSLLYIEETEQYHLLSKLKLSGIILFSKSYTSESVTDDTTNYASGGKMFGRLPLGSTLSEDTVQGRILLQNVNFVLLSSSSQPHPNKVFECKILDRGSDFLMLDVPEGFVTNSVIESNTSRKCQVQFVVNRLPFCELHSALDQLRDVSLLYPKDNILCASAKDQRNHQLGRIDSEVSLNSRQLDGLHAITSQSGSKFPPILLIGPFGTGKTMTVANSVIRLLTHSNSRVLICTHSNSAADLYVKDYLHPYIQRNGLDHLKVLRIYYKHRWVNSVSEVLKAYSLMDATEQSFRDPTIDDVSDADVVIVTLNTCYCLTQLGLPKGFFTHIMVDEAAQAKELETVIPLTLADENTKILMAGDHMQMNPEVCSSFSRKYRLHDSLFEKLTHLYPDDHSCKITLNINYRSHEQLVKYSSQLFYNDKLESRGNQPKHSVWNPLTFLAARGESLQQKHGTGYGNWAEVFETVDFIDRLVSQWPTKLWGKFDESSIGVVVPYMDQVTMIRAMLKKKSQSLRDISVERVFNVQGKQFRVVIINSVRTYHSCRDVDENEMDYAFLSNPKLLNTAITRAQSLVVVIGDPLSLCSVGKCRSLWVKFLETCNNYDSLYGITFAQIQDYIDYMDIEKAFKLNPNAEIFVPSIDPVPEFGQLPLQQVQGVSKNAPLSFAPSSVTQQTDWPQMHQTAAALTRSSVANQLTTTSQPVNNGTRRVNYLADVHESWKRHTSSKY